MRRLLLLLPIPVLLAVAPAGPPASPVVKKAWTELPTTTNHCPEEFDYFPGGGLRIFWCHAQEHLGLRDLQNLAGVPIWTSGPHTVDALDLRNARAFGHYNPVFVDRLADAVLVARGDPAFREATQPVYDQYVRARARLAWQVHHKLEQEPACANRELDGYVANMRAKEPEPMYYGRWFFFMNERFCKKGATESQMFDQGFDGGYDGNVADTLVGFWLRRRLDGTEARFQRALEELLRTYDAAWFEGPKDQPSP